jgi:hypothetical protein
MSYLIAAIVLWLAVTASIRPALTYLYRRRLYREGRIATVEQVADAVVRRGWSLVRLGRGRNAEIWVLDATGKERGDIEVMASDSGTLVCGRGTRGTQQLILLATGQNRFIDVPILPDVDP